MRFLAITFALACGVASAQLAPDTVKVHFSEAVLAGSSELPAGDYTITVRGGSTGNVVLMIRSDAGAAASVLVNPMRINAAAARDGGGVVLTRREARYVLDQVWLAPDMGYELLQH